MTSLKYRGGLARDGATWRFRFVFAGKVHKGDTGCRDRNAAVRWLADHRARLRAFHSRGTLPMPTVAELVGHWIQGNAAPLFSQGHLDRVEWSMDRYILPKVGKLEAAQLTTARVTALREAFLATPTRFGRPPSLHTLNKLMRDLRAIFAWGIKAGYLETLPFEVHPVAAQRRPKVWIPPEQVGPFLEAVDHFGPQVRAAIRCQLLMGLREVEVRLMRWDGIKASTYTPARTKGREARTIPIPAQVTEALKGLPREGPWIFPADDGEPHRANWLQKSVGAAGRAVGIQGLSPHRLRGSFATLLARTQAADPSTIQELLGHASFSTTAGYIEAAGLEHRIEASRKLELALGLTTVPESVPSMERTGAEHPRGKK